MKQIMILVKAMAKVRLRGMKLRGKSRGLNIFLGICIGYAALAVLASAGTILWMLTDAAAPLGLASVPMTMGLLVGCILVFIQSLFMINGEIFSSKDNVFLYSLPVSYRKLYTAKLVWIYLASGVVLWAIGLIAMGIYTAVAGSSLWFWLFGLLVLALLPLLPMCLGVLPALLMGVAVKRFRNRDLATVLFFSLFFVVIFAGYMLLINQVTVVLDNAGLAQSMVTGLLTKITAAVPPVGWAASAMVGTGLESLKMAGCFLLSAAVSSGILLVLGFIFFPRNAWATAETAAASKTRSGFTRRSVTAALAVKEWRTLVRSPIYAINGLLSIVLMPMLLIVYGSMGQSGANGMDINGLIDQYKTNPQLWLYIGAGLLFFASVSPATATCISREGSVFWRLRTLPVTARQLLKSKAIVYQLISVCSVLPAALFIHWRFAMPVSTSFYATSAALIYTAALVYLAMWIDFSRPKLQWDTENEAMKMNTNSLLSMAIVIGILVLLGFLTWGMVAIDMPYPAIWGVLALLGAGCIAGAYQLCLRAARNQFPVEEI